MKDLVVCVGESCHQNGAEMVVKSFQQLIKTHQLEMNIALKGCFCVGECCDKNGVSVRWGDHTFQVDPESPAEAFAREVQPIPETNKEA